VSLGRRVESGRSWSHPKGPGTTAFSVPPHRPERCGASGCSAGPRRSPDRHLRCSVVL